MNHCAKESINTHPIWAVIPTFQRCDLLDRTLASLAQANIPACVEAIIVVENGNQSGADVIVEKYQRRLTVKYRFSQRANKSHALNQVLAQAKNQFIVFFDDDVRVDPATLVAYANAVTEHQRGVFFAGRCFVDYEEPPPQWLQKYLPPSAKGWQLGEQKTRLQAPDALGANWGAFAGDLIAVGGFDEQRGPGTAARGQETAMQQKLMNNGVIGYYIPDAVVWHFVPKNRCNPEWCLDRVFQMGVRDGMNMVHACKIFRIRRVAACKTKRAAIRILLSLFGKHMSEAKKYHYHHRLSRHLGILQGLSAK